MTDAFHMLSDFSSFLISILAIRLSRRPATTRHAFGFQRAEVRFFSSIILINIE
jgi:Co/Zn/Cd efflux system component